MRYKAVSYRIVAVEEGVSLELSCERRLDGEPWVQFKRCANIFDAMDAVKDDIKIKAVNMLFTAGGITVTPVDGS